MATDEYLPRGCTRKPCPSCGGDERRSTKEVCDSCKKLIEDGKKYRKEKERMLADVCVRNVKVILPGSWCRPVYYGVRHWEEDRDKGAGTVLKKLAYLLARKVETEGNRGYLKDAGGLALFTEGLCEAEHHRTATAFMRQDIALALNELHSAIQRDLDSVSRRALAHGKNALLQLAQGEITSSELDGIE